VGGEWRTARFSVGLIVLPISVALKQRVRILEDRFERILEECCTPAV